MEDYTYLDVPGSQNNQDEEIFEIEEHLDEDYYTQSDDQITEVRVAPAKLHDEERVFEIDDECSTFGKHLALELQLMTERQRIIAKKLLSDVSYYGRLERLTERTEISYTKKPGN